MKRNNSLKSPSQLAICMVSSAILTFCPSASASVLTLDLSGGNGTETVDQYQGIGGSGWLGGWGFSRSVTASINSAPNTGVQDTTPLYSGGGNYLLAGQSTPGDLTAVLQSSYHRQLDSSAISLSQSLSYSFYFRPENSLSEDVSYTIFSRLNAPASGTDGGNTWSISTNLNAGTWQLGNGNGAGGVSNVNTGIAITAGTSYLFNIHSNPITHTWSVSIFDGENTYNSASLNYRNTSAGEGAFLSFGLRDHTPSTANNFYFSVDNIAVVPEPSSITLIGISLLAITWLRWKSKIRKSRV